LTENGKRKVGWKQPFVLPTGLFIRDYLLEHGEGYAQQIWRALKKGREDLGLHVGSYYSFWNNYFRNLRAMGMIVEVRKEPASKPGVKERIYYKITPGLENDPRWENIQDARWKIKEKIKEWEKKRRRKKGTV